jgi:hypothetical protein
MLGALIVSKDSEQVRILMSWSPNVWLIACCKVRKSFLVCTVNDVKSVFWARDFLVGPDPVIAMLCSEKNLHSTPIGLREISNEVFARLEEGVMSSCPAAVHSTK